MLFRRLFCCAFLIGICSGLFHSALQRFQVVPLIAQAEALEARALPGPESDPTPAQPSSETHAHANSPAHPHEHAHDHRRTDRHAPAAHAPERAHLEGHGHDLAQWMPQEGFERTAWTVTANILAAIGYALLLLPLLALWDRFADRPRASWRSGLAWGAGLWLGVFALPGIGLPPELPGMLAAGLQARQAWWFTAAVCSCAGLAALLLPRQNMTAWRCIGIALLALPFALGAPTAPSDAFALFTGEASLQMQALAAQFIPATALSTALYCLGLGALTGAAVRRWIRPLTVEVPGGRLPPQAPHLKGLR